MRMPKSGLYAITQTTDKTNSQIINDVKAAIRGGCSIIQYRDKNPIDAMELGLELKNICHNGHIPLIINDDIALAAEVQADGVHLGIEDGNIAEARAILGSEAIIGVSCYNSVQRALEAIDMGADYVAFGRFFPSGSKPLAKPADLKTLIEAKRVIQKPIVAIGGILPTNGSILLESGADLLAVIGGIFDHNPEQSARNFQELFDC